MDQQYPDEYYLTTSNNRDESIRDVWSKISQPIKTAGYSLRKKLQNRPQITKIKHINSNFFQAKLVCGHDDRTKVDAHSYPYNLICRLIVIDKRNNKYTATGFFISPTCIATSGHCVYLFNSEWAKEIIVIPGANGENDEPYGHQSSFIFQSVGGWTEENNRDFDYGAVVMPDETLFKKINSHFKLRSPNNETILNNSGYPSDKDGSQWECKGKALRFTTHRIYYDVDTEKGNSGSPVFVLENNDFYAIGIHSFGECPNFCIAINSRIIERFSEWSMPKIT